MDQPPPTLTKEDMLLRDIIAAGVKEALVEFQETVSQPKLDQVVEKHAEDLKSLAEASIESMSQSAIKLLEEHEKKLTKKAKALLTTAAEDVDNVVQHQVKKICKALVLPLTEKITELVLNAVSEVVKKSLNKLNEVSENSMPRVALHEVKEDLKQFVDNKLLNAVSEVVKKSLNKLNEVSENSMPRVALHEVKEDLEKFVDNKLLNAVSEVVKKSLNKLNEVSVNSMPRVALHEVKEDLEQFLDTKLNQIEKSLNKVPMIAEEPFVIDTSVDGCGNAYQSKSNVTNNESGSDSECSFIPFSGEYKDNAEVVGNLQEVKAKIMARQKEGDENPNDAGPSNIAKKKKLTLGSTKSRPPAKAPQVIDYSSDDDPPPAARSAAAAPKQKQVSLPNRPVKPEIPKNNEETCSICLGAIVQKVTLECAKSHSFCKEHIEEWLKFRTVCPLCNTEVDFFELPE